MSRLLYLFVAAAALGLWSPAIGDMSLAQLLTGKTTPLTITVKEMTPGWVKFSLTAVSETSGNDLMTRMFMHFPAAQAPALPDQNNSTYYTKGETLACNGETFLIAYQYPPTSQEMVEQVIRERNGQTTQAATFAKLLPTSTTPLHMTLLNIKSISSLAGIHPAETAAQLDAAAKAASTQLAGPIAIRTRRAMEASMQANLHTLRNALEQFNADTGIYPLSLRGLTVTDRDPQGSNGERVPPGCYHGPYLRVEGGGCVDAPGIPLNPLAHGNKLADSWKYDPQQGSIIPAMDGRTVDGGIAYKDL